MFAMRTCVLMLGLSVCGIVRAIGVCDDPPIPIGINSHEPPHGGFCHQDRAVNLVASNTNPPAFSDLALNQLANPNVESVWFQLDASQLLGVGTSMDHPVYVFELGVARLIDNQMVSADSRTLSLSLLRDGSGRWTVNLDWFAVAPSWSAANYLVPQALVHRAVQMPRQLDRFSIQINPDANWQTVNVDVAGLDTNDNPVNLTLFRGAFIMPPGFALSAGSPNRNAPMRLRSGLIGGDLKWEGMKTHFVYSSPTISFGS